MELVMEKKVNKVRVLTNGTLELHFQLEMELNEEQVGEANLIVDNYLNSSELYNFLYTLDLPGKTNLHAKVLHSESTVNEVDEEIDVEPLER